MYVVELVVEASVCAKRNIHDRTLEDLTKICSNWVKTPDHMINLDVRTLLQDDAIQEVEMEDAIDDDESTNNTADNNDNNADANNATADNKNNDNENNGDSSTASLGDNNDKGENSEGDHEDEDYVNHDEGFRKVIRSKWDGDVSETNLGKHWLRDSFNVWSMMTD